LRSNAILFQRIDEKRRDLLARGKGCAMHGARKSGDRGKPEKGGRGGSRSEKLRTPK
jgi:hypothetical protein